MSPTLLPRIGHSAPPKRPMVYPHQYDLVHDSFGPGVFLGWLMLAYGVAAHFWGPREHRLFMLLLDKDLVFTLAYPVVTSLYLLAQFARYPGPKEKLWEWESPDEKFVKYAAAIWAPAQVCLYATGMNIVLMILLSSNGCEKRGRVVFLVNIWLFLVLVIVNSHDGQHFVWYMGGILGTAVCFCASGPGILFITTYLFAAAVRVYVMLYSLLRGQVLKSLAQLASSVCTALLVCFCMLFPITALIYLYGYWFAFPTSDHSFSDFGQLSALGFGCVNLAFTLYGLWKEHGMALLVDVLTKAEYEGEMPVVPPKYEPLKNETAGQADIEIGRVSREQERDEQSSSAGDSS